MKTISVLLIGFIGLITSCSNNSKQSIDSKKSATTCNIVQNKATDSLLSDYIKLFDSYSERYNYDWHGVSKLPTFYPIFKCSEISKLLKNENHLFEVNPNAGYFINHLRVLDFNADEELDIIYSGPTGGVTEEVIFVLGSKNDFKKILTIEQGVVKVDWKDNRISKLYTHDWDCCAGTSLLNSVYDFKYDSVNFPTITKVFQSIEYKFMDKPIEFFDKPIEFKVNIKGSLLRFSPVVDDTSYLLESRVGNKIGFVKLGASGIAFGLKKDKLGKVWWYVIISPDQTTIQNVLYIKDLDTPTHVIGWIKSNELTKK